MGENLASSLNDLETWTELSADSVTSAVLAQVIDPDGLPVSEPILVSPDGISFQKLPAAARDADGNFFVVWEAENPFTGLDEIFARRYDSAGNRLDEGFAVSGKSEAQQAEPSITVDPDNNVAVVWTHYGLEEKPAVIELQIYDNSGVPSGDAIDLPANPGEEATAALVQSDAQGNLYVAWTVEDRNGAEGDVYVQKLLKGGVLSDPPMRVNTTRAGVGRLVALRVERGGSFRVVWEGRGPDGQGDGLRERRYDAQGRSVGDETPVSSVD
jgi:hypothetical protein